MGVDGKMRRVYWMRYKYDYAFFFLFLFECMVELIGPTRQ